MTPLRNKDNGIKIFNADGYKLADDIEEEIEKIMDSYDDLAATVCWNEVGRFKYEKLTNI